MKIEIPNGDLVDKISILTIKLEKIKNSEKLNNIKKEFEILYNDMLLLGITKESKSFLALKDVNLILWEVEDQIRIKEAAREFDEKFIELARRVYFENDKRSAIKREINLKTGSNLVEEKEYVKY